MKKIIPYLIVALAGGYCIQTAYDRGYRNGFNQGYSRKKPTQITWYVPGKASLPPTKMFWRKAGTLTLAPPYTGQFHKEAQRLHIDDKTLMDVDGCYE